MSPTINLKALPLHRVLALAGAALMLIALNLPWMSLSFADELVALGVDSDESRNGWNGIGVLAGLLAVTLIAWEGARAIGRVKLAGPRLDYISVALAAAATIFGFLQFIRAFTSAESELGFTYGASYGAYMILFAALVLGGAVAWYLRDTLGIGGTSQSDPLPPPPPPPAGSARSDATRPDASSAEPEDQ